MTITTTRRKERRLAGIADLYCGNRSGATGSAWPRAGVAAAAGSYALPAGGPAPRRALSPAFSLVLVLAFCGALVFAPPFAGNARGAENTYYRWFDELGKLVVSDRPPQDVQIEYEVVSPRSNFVRRVSPGQGAVPAEVTPRPGNEFEQVNVNSEQIEVIPKNPESCARAKANLETLASAARIRIRDPDSGELRFISEDEKETQRQKARDTIRVHCE